MLLHSRFDEKRPIELDYLRRNSTMEDVKLHDDGIQFRLVQLKADLLKAK